MKQALFITLMTIAPGCGLSHHNSSSALESAGTEARAVDCSARAGTFFEQAPDGSGVERQITRYTVSNGYQYILTLRIDNSVADIPHLDRVHGTFPVDVTLNGERARADATIFATEVDFAVDSRNCKTDTGADIPNPSIQKLFTFGLHGSAINAWDVWFQATNPQTGETGRKHTGRLPSHSDIATLDYAL